MRIEFGQITISHQVLVFKYEILWPEPTMFAQHGSGSPRYIMFCNSELISSIIVFFPTKIDISAGDLNTHPVVRSLALKIIQMLALTTWSGVGQVHCWSCSRGEMGLKKLWEISLRSVAPGWSCHLSTALSNKPFSIITNPPPDQGGVTDPLKTSLSVGSLMGSGHLFQQILKLVLERPNYLL